MEIEYSEEEPKWEVTICHRGQKGRISENFILQNVINYNCPLFEVPFAAVRGTSFSFSYSHLLFLDHHRNELGNPQHGFGRLFRFCAEACVGVVLLLSYPIVRVPSSTISIDDNKSIRPSRSLSYSRNTFLYLNNYGTQNNYRIFHPSPAPPGGRYRRTTRLCFWGGRFT